MTLLTLTVVGGGARGVSSREECRQVVRLYNSCPGLLVMVTHIPSTSDRAMSKSAFVSTASRAARLSLSLMLITYRPRKLLLSAPNVRKAAICHLRLYGSEVSSYIQINL